MEDEKVLFVFYTLTENPTGEHRSWTYKRFPKGWWWVGAGSTSPIGKPLKRFQREEQFMGPKGTQEAMAEYLESVFKGLKQKGIIAIFKIRKSYKP